MYNRYDNDLHPRETVLDSLSSIIDHNDSLQDHIKFLSSVSMFSRASQPRKNKRNLTSTCDHLTKLGTLSNEDDDSSENVAKRRLIASIWTRSICQMQATFPGVGFLRILFKFKKRKENSWSYVHVLHKTSNRRFHFAVVQWTSKKCAKIVMHGQSRCFDH